MITHRREADVFAENLRRISALADQTAVHRKKFEFALSQLRKVSHNLSANHSDDNPLTPEEQQAAELLREQLQELKKLIAQNLLQTWSIPTIENPCNDVLHQLLAIFGKVKEAVAVFDNALSLEVAPDSAQWSQFHVLDLRAISASFTQYLKLEDIDAQLARSIETRLRSINRTLDDSSSEDFANRVFSPIPVNYQSWRVNYSDFEEIKAIGGGVSANVYYGREKRTGAEVAIKKFKFQKLNGSKLQSFQREVAVLATAIHPAVLKLIGATDTPPFCIITDWMPNGSLYHDLHRHHRLDATGRTIAAFDIARGMQFLHSCQIVHRDLKSLNVLLDKNNRIRICDFGFSRHATEESLMTQNIGTPHWMAPEVLATNTNYSSKVDVYAFGIVLWELATSQTPYKGMDAPQIIAQVLHMDLRPTMPSDINPAMRDLITQCWDRNPDIRPSFDEIVRRIQSTEAVYNGTNMEELKEYIKHNATSYEQIKRDAEIVVKKVEDGQMSLKEATRRLSKHGIPHDVVEGAWKLVPSLSDKFSVEDISNYMALFVKSSKIGGASEILRQMPLGSVPADVVHKFVTELPTGSVEIDTNIVVTACRNGAADLCVVYATNPVNVALALNVVARDGVDIQLKAAVCDRCVQCMGAVGTEVAAAALRCLLSIREFKRIPLTTLKTFISSADATLSSCAYVAIAALAKEGLYPPIELFEVLLSKMSKDNRAALPVIMSCRDQKLAERLVTLFEQEPPKPTENALKALISAAHSPNLRSRIKSLVEQISFHEIEAFVSPVNSLMAIVN